MTWSRHHWPAAPDPGGQRPDLSSTFVGRLVFPTGHGPRSIIVECHPALVGKSAAEFRRLLHPTQLEVAMGLEVADDGILAKLHKRVIA